MAVCLSVDQFRSCLGYYYNNKVNKSIVLKYSQKHRPLNTFVGSNILWQLKPNVNPTSFESVLRLIPSTVLLLSLERSIRHDTIQSRVYLHDVMLQIKCAFSLPTEAKAHVLGPADLYVKTGSSLMLTCVLSQGPHDLGTIFWYKGKLPEHYHISRRTSTVRHETPVASVGWTPNSLQTQSPSCGTSNAALADPLSPYENLLTSGSTCSPCYIDCQLPFQRANLLDMSVIFDIRHIFLLQLTSNTTMWPQFPCGTSVDKKFYT